MKIFTVNTLSVAVARSLNLKRKLDGHPDINTLLTNQKLLIFSHFKTII